MSTASVPPAYVPIIQQSATQNGIQPSLLASLLNQESGFNYNARNVDKSASGTSVDQGIAQINSAAYPDVTTAQADNPYVAIPMAAGILAAHLKSCKTVTGALEAYNSGQCSGDSGYSSAILANQSAYASLDTTSGGSGMFSGLSTSLFGGSTDWTRLALIGIVVVFGFLFIYKGID